MMIRMILLSTAFVGVTAALVVYQPGAQQIRDRLDPGYAPEVSRAASGPDSLSPEPAAAPVTQARAQAEGVPASDTASVLAALVRESQGGTPPAAPVAAPGNPVLALTAAVQAAQGARDGELARTTSAILAELGQAPAATTDDDALMAMTQSVLAGLGGAQRDAEPKPADLQTLIVQAVRQGQSDAYLDALLNEARDSGRITVPEALITSDGKVDTTTLLATLVQRSVGSGAAPAPGGDAATLLPDAATRPKSRQPAETQVYTVQPGDSLAAISFRFYGETLMYTAIFEANRDKIDSPDKIRIGQQLTIPVL